MKSKLIIVVIVVLLLIAGGVYFVFGKGKGPTGTNNPVQQTSTSPKSLKDLLGLENSQKCTFTNTEEKVSSQGVVYISGGKVRVDFDTTIEEKVTKSHMIVDRNTSYFWTDESKTGFTTTFDPNNQPSAEGNANPASSFDANKPANYQCSGWITDSSVFNRPSDVKFSDMSKLLVPDTSDNSSQCSYCESLTGDSKAQCLSALKCN